MDISIRTEGLLISDDAVVSASVFKDEIVIGAQAASPPIPKDLETNVSVSKEREITDVQAWTEPQNIEWAQLYYQPLDVKAKEIRLLEVIDDSYEDHYVHCTLETASLTSPQLKEYVALSYCWGDSSLTTKVHVNKSEVDVKQNLDAALRQLRLRGYRRVWVDALCVNQADEEERGSQVQIMQQIYSRAHLVISWIGSVDDDTAEAVKFLLERSTSSQIPSTPINLDEMTPLPSPRFPQDAPLETAQHSPRYSRLEKAKRRWIRNQWSLIQDFFSQDYWKRVWVIQEVAVATDLRILYGKSEMSWDNVAAAILHWKQTLTSLPTSHLSHLYAAQLLDLRDQFRNKSRMSLVNAMLVSSKAMATDPRDKIFALLGITWDGPYLVPFPNYRSPLKDVLANLTLAILMAERSLNLICIRSPYQPVDDEQQSWIPPWLTNAEFSYWSKSLTIIENSLLTDRPQVPGALIFRSDPNFFSTAAPSSLIVKGVILDEVYALSSTFGSQGDDLQQCDLADQARLEKNIIKFYPSGPGNALWQALCIDHIFHPVPRDGGYYTARSVAKYRSCFARLWSEGELELQGWLKDNADMKIGKHTLSQWAKGGNNAINHTPAEMTTFCKTLQEILESSLRLAVTGFGYLGMVPSQTKRGDRVCFLRGCSVPVILRAVATGYKVIGCCSVRTRFEPYAEACRKFASGADVDVGVPLNIRELTLV